MGAFPENHLFPTVRITLSTEAETPTPGYDVILMKKGMLDIQQEAKDHLAQLDYENPDDLDKIYFYKSVIDTTEGVMIYARRLFTVRCRTCCKKKLIRREKKNC